ncbi:19967_t:CDS:2, partial [Racocetra persica]
EFEDSTHSNIKVISKPEYEEEIQKDNNTNPLDTFNQLIHHQNQSYFTSIIGYFYQFGIGTEISYRLANKFYSRSNFHDVKTSNS